MKKRYFKTGQKIFLRAMTPAEGFPSVNTLSTYLQESGAGFFDLLLPYNSREGEEYPFTAGEMLELRSDSMGLGLVLSARFQEWRGRDLIRVTVQEELRVIQRRLHPRLDTQIGLRFTRGRGLLRTFHGQWEKNARILQAGGGPPQASNFPRTRVNLSAGGIRFTLRAPVDVADLCLILAELEPNGKAMCLLAEVVWAGEIQEERQTAGMRFLSILEADQKKIEDFIRNNWGQIQET